MLYRDADIVVVDKPVGVAAHPSPGLDRADGARRAGRARHRTQHVRRGRAPGHRAPAGRRHHRGDGGRASEHAYRCSRTRSGTARSRRSTTRSCRAIRTRARAPSTRRSAGTRRRTGSSRSSPAAGTASRTTRRSRRFPPPACCEVHLETGRTHQIRVHFAAMRHPCVGRPDLRRRPGAGRPARPEPAVAARPVAGLRPPGGRPLGGVHQPVPGRP